MQRETLRASLNSWAVTMVIMWTLIAIGYVLGR